MSRIAKLSWLFTREDGAVTVDWVVLSAAVIGLAMLALTPIAFGTENVTRDVAEFVGNASVSYGNN